MRNKMLFIGVVLGVGLLGLSVAAGPQATGTQGLTGTVRSADGKALEGVTVSARSSEKTFTTTVFTDAQGQYFFPALESGRYRVWAQAVGFAKAQGEIAVDGMRQARQELTLSPVADFSRQLSGAEWLDSLPAQTVADRRMKEIFRVNCIECHSASVALHQPFDEKGWTAILSLMERMTYNGWRGEAPPPTSDYENGGGIVRDTTIKFHKAELAQWLARVRGPNSAPLNFKVHPRPTGDAARVVVTEYDIPGDGIDSLAWNTADDWSNGPASANQNNWGQPHDLVVDHNGNAWLTESAHNVNRTLIKVTASTGQVTGLKILRQDGSPRSAHGIGLARNGIVWFDTNGSLGRLDPATEKVELFTPPKGMGSGASVTTDEDGTGKIWSGSRYGAVVFDPATKKWKYLQNVSPTDGFTYGAAGDADGNGWWTNFNAERVQKGDPKTGKVTEFVMQSPESADRRGLATPADREFYEANGALGWGAINSVPGAEAPRRLGGDKTGDTVWVPNFIGMNVAGINTRTHKVEYHPLPIPGAPYFTTVDKNHMVWTAIMDEKVAKLDPKGNKWTLYKLPTLGCEPRHITVDDVRGDVWVPCDRASRIARLQFRTEQQLQALKAGSPQAAR